MKVDSPALARPPSSGLRLYTGVALVASATLMLQLIQTRILSVIVWYHLAFFVISIAMFGLTAGAIWVYFRGERFSPDRLSADLTYFTSAFAVSIPLSLLLQLTLAPVVSRSVISLVTWIEFALCLALPYVLSGIVLSLALTRSPLPVGRVYGADMIGAAVGCLSVLALLDAVDAPSAILCVGAVVAVAGALFQRSGIGSESAGSPLSAVFRRPAVLAGVLAASALANSATSHGLHLLVVKGQFESRGKNLLFERWNSFSRVAVFSSPSREPWWWGRSPRMPLGQWTVEKRNLNIDGDAGTTMYRFAGDLPSMLFLKYDVTNLVYYLPDRRKAAIVGVGGGRDVLSALVFGVDDVTGVEINPIFVRLLTHEPGFADYAGLRDLPGVRFVTDEARSWFARTTESFDIIQMTLIDTWAATGAGAFTLSENGLYTVEGWRTFLSRLTPRGVFTVSRWYAPGAVDETGRLVSLTAAALMSMGVRDVQPHLLLVSVDNIATLLVSRSPFSSVDVQSLDQAAAELEYRVLVGPNTPPASGVLEAIVSSRSVDELKSRTSALELDLTPPTDDRPFFFNQLPLQRPGQVMTWARQQVSQGSPEGIASGNLAATLTLLTLLVIAAGLVTLTIVVPAGRALRDVGARLVVGGSAYFVLIGVGFMAVEIGLVQRMSVFLGHPIYALSIVLFTLILATGIGSLVSERFALDRMEKFGVWALLTAAYTGSLPFWLPGMVLGAASAGLVSRATLCVAIVAPAGFLMGFAFPTGMRLASAVDRRPTPWFWGINGAAGVLSAILAVACSLAFGIGVTLLLGAACYLLLIPAAMVIGFHEARLTEGRSGA